MKIQIRCAGRSCENSIYVPLDRDALGVMLALESWVLVRNPQGLQPVCWGCAEKLELPPDVLERVRQLHASVQKGTTS